MELKEITLGKIIRWYKGRTKFEINKKSPKIYFSWQSRFHDRIIRDDKELANIREYIYYNPYKHLETDTEDYNWEKAVGIWFIKCLIIAISNNHEKIARPK